MNKHDLKRQIQVHRKLDSIQRERQKTLNATQYMLDRYEAHQNQKADLRKHIERLENTKEEEPEVQDIHKEPLDVQIAYIREKIAEMKSPEKIHDSKRVNEVVLYSRDMSKDAMMLDPKCIYSKNAKKGQSPGIIGRLLDSFQEGVPTLDDIDAMAGEVRTERTILEQRIIKERVTSYKENASTYEQTQKGPSRVPYLAIHGNITINGNNNSIGNLRI